jgi:hypothetical protein
MAEDNSNINNPNINFGPIGGCLKTSSITFTPPAKPWKFCPECAQKLEAEWKFCAGCGEKLNALPYQFVWPTYPSYPVTVGGCYGTQVTWTDCGNGGPGSVTSQGPSN